MIDAKPPLQTKHVWSIRAKLQMDGRKRDFFVRQDQAPWECAPDQMSLKNNRIACAATLG